MHRSFDEAFDNERGWNVVKTSDVSSCCFKYTSSHSFQSLPRIPLKASYLSAKVKKQTGPPLHCASPDSNHHMVSIPQEVSEIVIDLLATNSFALKSCSLVCQLWLHASRKWLFQRLSINADNYNWFFDTFQAEYPQIPRFTQYCTSLDISYADE